jgi:hypothetical protein
LTREYSHFLERCLSDYCNICSEKETFSALVQLDYTLSAPKRENRYGKADSPA